MPSALPSIPAAAIESPESTLRLRVAVVRLRALCRSAAATFADLRAAMSSAPDATSAPWNVLLGRVNHDLAALATTQAEIGVLRALASAPVKRDVTALRRTVRSLERELETFAALADDLRVVRRCEPITVLGLRNAPVDVVAEVVSLEIRTAVFPIMFAPSATPRQPPRARKVPLGRRGFVLLLAAALLPRRFADWSA